MATNVINIGGGALGLGDGVFRMDARQVRQMRDHMNRRHFDSMGPGQGLHLARQLEHIYDEVLREEFPPTNAMSMIPVDGSVPVGAKTHTVRRISQQGEAAVHRGNAREIPRVSVSQEEESFPVHHYVIGIGFDIFELAASDFANSKLRQELQDASQVIMQEFLNEKTWFGDEDHNIYGVLNYPWTPKRVLPLAATEGADTDAMLAQINAAAGSAHEESKTVYSPNAVSVSPRMYRYMSTTRISNSVSDTTVLEFFKKANPRIQTVEEAWELQGRGPGGSDIMFFHRRDRRSIANVIPQGFTMLPVQQVGIEYLIPCYMSHGGVIQRDVLNNLVCYIEVD